MRIRLYIKSFCQNSLALFLQKFRKILLQKQCRVLREARMPTLRRKMCVLTSPHGNKDSREQYEFRLHKAVWDVGLEPRIADNIFSVQIPSSIFISVKAAA
jgi:small subunit ribosomal protein S10